MGCNAHNHPPDCDCGFGGDTGGAFYGLPNLALQSTSYFSEGTLGQTAWLTHCPICGEEVYYYQNDYGSKVWFQSLGWPWTKHPCFEKDDERNTQIYQHLQYRPLEQKALNLIGVVYWNGWHFGYLRSADGSVSFQSHWVVMKQTSPKFGLTLILQPNGRCVLVGPKGTKPIEIYSQHLQSRLSEFSSFGAREKIAQNALACFLRVRELTTRAKAKDERIYVCISLYDCTDLDIKELSIVTGLSEYDVWLIADDKLKPKSIQAKGKLDILVSEIVPLLQKKKARRITSN